MKEDREYLEPSRSAKKRAAKTVEETARKLVELSDAAVRKLPVDDELLGEIRQARATHGFAARQRQLKYLAGVLRRRDDDLLLLRDFLEGVDQSHQQEQLFFHSLEELRDRLCTPEDFPQALQEVMDKFPGLDQGALTRLAHQAHATGGRQFSREIFRFLRQAAKNTPTP
jgi:ribosome-associated protein